MTADGLNEKQARFVAEYMIDLNATQAATRSGYSAKTAYAIGHELLKKPEIQAALTAAMQDRSERTQITADRVLEELARIGFADLRKLFDEDGSLRDVADMDPDTVAAIASIELQVSGPPEAPLHTSKVKLWDKVAALDRLGRHFAMFTDRTLNETTVRPVQEMTDEELMAIAARETGQ